MAGDAAVEELLRTGRDTARRLRRGLANALRSARSAGGAMTSSAASSPAHPAPALPGPARLDVFRTRAMVQGRSTAVSILLDASGSMTIRKMDVARLSVRVLLEALGDLAVPTEALTFTTGNQRTCPPEDLADACLRYTASPTWYRVDQGVRRAGQEQPAAPARCGGHRADPAGEAMQIAAGGCCRARSPARCCWS